MPVYSVNVRQCIQGTKHVRLSIYAANPDEIVEAISEESSRIGEMNGKSHISEMNLWNNVGHQDILEYYCDRDDICVDRTFRDVDLVVRGNSDGK